MFRTFYKLYLLLFISVATSAVVILPVLQYLFITRIGTSADDDLDEALYTLRDRLAVLPSSQWADYIAKTRAPFSLIAIELLPRPTLGLSPAEDVTLDRGYLVQRRHGEAMAGLPRSALALRMSRSSYGLIHNLFNVLAWSTFSLVLLLGIFIWLRSHWLDLGRLRLAAERFGRGELDARAGLPEGSSVASLAKCFDSMAGRIQLLVAHQNEMINAISHELRTPIARFGFSLALLQTSDDRRQRQRHIDALTHDVAELDELVGELLSYGALDRAGRAPDRQPVQLGELLDSVVGSLALEMDSLSIQCSVDMAAQAEPILLDPRLTARALLNLVKNAMRYGRGRVGIVARIEPAALVIDVDDDGIGIPLADREVVFEPFHRLDRSRDRSTGGFGLGLAIVKRAITSQGGDVRVLDSPLGGARFEIMLPLPRQHRGEEAAG